jgi:tRNA A-37 threonylcarbamoyl transferase component Bud32
MSTSPLPTTPRFAPLDPAELAADFPQLEIVELLGVGGMGVVYKARQRRLDRWVALKILPREIATDPTFAERFGREARAMASLQHAHIVVVYDFGQVRDLHYLLMEYVDGLNLRQLLRAGQLQPRQALAIIPQICEGLQYAHDQGILHRDIKPENILVDSKGRAKIADFGLAKLVRVAEPDQPLTRTHQVMGTWNYMAPEQIERPQLVDHRADVYSLGVVFYEILTGELPIGRFSPPSQKVTLDVRLDEVVLRSLEKDRDRRYQHASDLKSDVDAIAVTSQPVRQPTATVAPTVALTDSHEATVEQLVVEMLEMWPMKGAAVRLYREKTGCSAKVAEQAVDSIARTHGTVYRPRPFSWRRIAPLLILYGVSAVGASYDLSPLITDALLFLAWLYLSFVWAIPTLKRAWRFRGTTYGFFHGIGALFVLLAPAGIMLAQPEWWLNWLYQTTGAQPGRHDVAFFRALLWLVIFIAFFCLSWPAFRVRFRKRGG